jgi:hypothetical protein
VRVSSCSSARTRFAAAAALAGALVLGGAPLAAQSADVLHLRAIELEADLAKKPALYLVLDPAAHKLEVRVRGTALTEVPIREMSSLLFAGLFAHGEAPPLPAPALWTVVEGPGDTDRETLAPTTLRPYTEEEEAEPAAKGTAPAAPAKPKVDSDKPPSYRVRLDVGWQLYLVNEPPRLDRLRRFGAAIRDGWQRLHGQEPSHPPLLALVVAPEDAQRLHHLFRSGMPILVLPGA